MMRKGVSCLSMKVKRYRHGDVMLKQVTQLPKGFKKEKGKVLQYGEVTGHMHQFIKGDFQFYTNGVKRYVDVLTPATISHEEHKPYIIEPGIYEQIQEREYSYEDEEMRTVID